jgi:hypothetical protein
VLQIKKKLKRFDYYDPTPANDNIVRTKKEKQLLDNGVEYTG